MEQQTDVQTLLDRGEALLRENHPAEAAAEYATALQQDPQVVGGHLGLAETNLALGQYAIAQQAAQQVLQLAPGTADAAIAEAILAVLASRYEVALEALEREIELDPTRPYVHAMRAYVLRRLGRNYDAALAEARAARSSGKRDWDGLFPKVMTYAAPAPLPQPELAEPSQRARGSADNYGGTPHRIAYSQQRAWQGNRRLVRLRLLFATTPLVTYTLMAVNIAIWLLAEALPFVGLGFVADGIYVWGIQDDAAIVHDPLQAYRFITAMFLHDPSNIFHIGLNMLSLYFVGIITERVFGAGRYTLIYFLSGIVGGLTQFSVDLLTHHPSGALGASGAIFGIFGAFGAFILLRRRALGPAANSIIGQWVFFLALNLAFSFIPGFTIGGAAIAGYDHLGGLAAGLIFGALLSPVIGARRR